MVAILVTFLRTVNTALVPSSVAILSMREGQLLRGRLERYVTRGRSFRAFHDVRFGRYGLMRPGYICAQPRRNYSGTRTVSP